MIVTLYHQLKPTKQTKNRKQLSKMSSSSKTTPPVAQPAYNPIDATPKTPMKTPKSPTKGTFVIGNGMNMDNLKALEVNVTQDSKAFVKHVSTDQTTGKQLSYSEMRMRYG